MNELVAWLSIQMLLVHLLINQRGAINSGNTHPTIPIKPGQQVLIHGCSLSISLTITVNE